MGAGVGRKEDDDWGDREKRKEDEWEPRGGEEREGMMKVYLEDVARHFRREVLRQEESFHQKMMDELGEGGIPLQEDLHPGVEEVEIMVLQREVHHQKEISENEMVWVLRDQV